MLITAGRYAKGYSTRHAMQPDLSEVEWASCNTVSSRGDFSGIRLRANRLANPRPAVNPQRKQKSNRNLPEENL